MFSLICLDFHDRLEFFDLCRFSTKNGNPDLSWHLLETDAKVPEIILIRLRITISHTHAHWHYVSDTCCSTRCTGHPNFLCDATYFRQFLERWGYPTHADDIEEWALTFFSFGIPKLSPVITAQCGQRLSQFLQIRNRRHWEAALHHNPLQVLVVLLLSVTTERTLLYGQSRVYQRAKWRPLLVS